MIPRGTHKPTPIGKAFPNWSEQTELPGSNTNLADRVCVSTPLSVPVMCCASYPDQSI